MGTVTMLVIIPRPWRNATPFRNKWAYFMKLLVPVTLHCHILLLVFKRIKKLFKRKLIKKVKLSKIIMTRGTIGYNSNFFLTFTYSYNNNLSETFARKVPTATYLLIEF